MESNHGKRDDNESMTVELPEEFRELLIEMTQRFILERPTDPVEFALHFLSQRKKESYSVFRKSLLGRLVLSEKRRRPGQFYTFPEESINSEPVVYFKTDRQKEKLRDAIMRAMVFQKLDPYSRDAVLNAMRPISVKKGDLVIEQGKLGRELYVIEHGTFEIIQAHAGHRKSLKIIKDSGYFGDHSLIFDVPTNASVKAKTDGELWALDRNTFRKMVVKGEYQRRQILETLLDNILIFSFLSQEEREKLADLLSVVRVGPGETVIRQGDAAEGMYFIIRGELQVIQEHHRGRHQEDEKEIVATLHAGDYFGELALITNRPRNATVVTLLESKLAFLGVMDFERVLGRYMDILKRNIDVYQDELLRLSRVSITPEHFR